LAAGSPEAETVRVAVAQFGAGLDAGENLATCLRMIDQAAAEKPQLIVLPEFLNHASWWRDEEHSYAVAVALDGPFLSAIAAKAGEHHCYIMANCTVRRRNNAVTDTNILFDPTGRQVAASDKQVLMGNENNFLEPAQEVSPVVDTPIGRIAMYSCMDGVIPETARGLALRGAQILCNSLNSFAADEATLHIPVRAAENKVFVVAANKVGPLVPEESRAAVAERLKIAPEDLNGAGESQIVAPDGTILAKCAANGEEVAVADIVVTEADAKVRPDGTDLFAARRPDLYAPIAAEATTRNAPAAAEKIEAAIFVPSSFGQSGLDEAAKAVVEAGEAGIDLLVLPELFFAADGAIDDPAEAADFSDLATDALHAAVRGGGGGCAVTTTLVERSGDGFSHTGVLIGGDGVRLRQRQLHACARHDPWCSAFGDGIESADLDWGRLALVIGGDAVFPETFRLAALKDAQVAAVPTRLLEAWELETGFPERAAENRMSLVVASPSGPDDAGAIIAIDHVTLWSGEREGPFDGHLNNPVVTRARGAPGLTRAPVHPARAANREITHRTDVVANRPWWLAQAITAPL
jgi:predicted amidohydrolase